LRWVEKGWFFSTMMEERSYLIPNGRYFQYLTKYQLNKDI
jgi:hypothetical protein